MFEDSQEQVFSSQSTETLNKYLTKVFGWMAIGVFATFAVAFLISSIPSVALAINQSGSVGLFASAIIQFGLIFYMQAKIANLQVTKAKWAFIIYSIITGLNFSVFFLVIGIGTIFTAFFMAALFFGCLCLIGYTTKRNLAKFGTLCMAGLIALVAYEIFAMIFHWDQSVFWISFVGLVIFVGLTAWDMQSIKESYFATVENSLAREALAINGAFELYLDFLNIFIYILQLLLATSSDD